MPGRVGGIRSRPRALLDEVLGVRVDLIEHQLAEAVVAGIDDDGQADPGPNGGPPRVPRPAPGCRTRYQ